MATYTIIGSDQKQYSLVTEDNIRRWIAEGRLNEQSLIKTDGEAEFRPLPDFPEFADALAAKAASTIAPPPLPTEAAVPAKTSGLAISSLVLGILGLITCGTTALIGLILGIIALVKVKQSRGALSGGGIALAGIIVSAIFLLMIPVFAAMLLPALASAKQHAQTINCVRNVKQLSLAVRMYAADNQDHYPAATNWCNAIQPEVGTTNNFHCPADFSGGRCSYAFNARLSGVEEGKVDPNTVVLFEADGNWNTSGGRELMLTKSRHSDWIMVGFADGHVEQVTESRRSQLRWDP
jgi:prepilin-type processing-associated H-X9-DG protein